MGFYRLHNNVDVGNVIVNNIKAKGCIYGICRNALVCLAWKKDTAWMVVYKYVAFAGSI